MRWQNADEVQRGMYDVLPDSETILAQFNHLMQELVSGEVRRNSFRPWEIDLLLDMESCDLREPSRRVILQRYQKAVRRQMTKGARLPMKLSEYMEAAHAKRAVNRRGPGPD
ncbi:MAG TPA: hypothetical protein VH639_16085 [Bryobacteraceae bacterium]|jgi:hypothetical protein